jgi:hypothetical protein
MVTFQGGFSKGMSVIGDRVGVTSRPRTAHAMLDAKNRPMVDEFKPGLTFHAIALDHMMADAPQRVGQLLDEVTPQFAERKLEALPLRTFRIQRTVDALRAVPGVTGVAAASSFTS